jgi:hypothetical protein
MAGSLLILLRSCDMPAQVIGPPTRWSVKMATSAAGRVCTMNVTPL